MVNDLGPNFRLGRVILSSVAALGLCAVLSSCTVTINDNVKWNWGSNSKAVKGSDKIITDQRSLPKFEAIVLATAGNIVVKERQSKQSVLLTFDDNLVPLIKTEVQNGILTISSDEPHTSTNDLKILVDVANLRSVIITGSGNADISNLKRQSFQTTITGSGNVSATGSADSASAVITGSGSIHFDKLISKDVSVQISGSGNADVNASNSVDATISGSGSVKYSGNPADVKQSIAGSGSVFSE